MHKNGDGYEFILTNTPEGIEIGIYKKSSTNKLMKIDFSIKKTPGFSLMTNLTKDELEEVEEGLLLYTGKLTIYQLSTLMRGLRYKVGIELIDESKISIEDKIKGLKKRLEKSLDEEDYMECAKLRDELKTLEKNVQH